MQFNFFIQQRLFQGSYYYSFYFTVNFLRTECALQPEGHSSGDLSYCRSAAQKSTQQQYVSYFEIDFILDVTLCLQCIG